ARFGSSARVTTRPSRASPAIRRRPAWWTTGSRSAAPSSTCSTSAGAPTTSRGETNVTSERAPGADRLRLIRKDSFEADPNPTAGMTRQHAITADGLTSGTVTTEPGMMSGWHHHGTHEPSIYVATVTPRTQLGGGPCAG